MNKKFKVASPPHLRRRTTTSIVMIDVIISLLPAIFMSIKYFGLEVAFLIIACILSAGISQFLFERIFNKKSELWDYSFAVTGILLALILPHTCPPWVASIGSAFAIIFGKCIYGGLGKNIFNPALVGRIFLMISFPQYVLNYRTYDGGAGATLLPLMKYRGVENLYTTFGSKGNFFRSLLTGQDIYGSMGEVSVIAILIGLIYLKLKGHVKLYIPFSIISSVFILSYFLGYNPYIYTLSGGLIFASVYIATDMVSSPYTKSGSIIYSIVIALLVILIRSKTSHPEGTAYAILFANIFVPFINKYTKPKVFGKGYRMKEIRVAIIALLISVISISAIFRIDKLIEIDRKEKYELYKENLMLSLVADAKKLGKDEETIIYNRFLFRPIYGGNNELIAYVVESEAKGYSQDIVKFFLAIDLEGRSIGYHILEHNETNGLGSRISNKEWQNVFIGLTKESKFNIEKDAFVGATYTFSNMHRVIISILRAYEEGKSNNKKDNIEVDYKSGATEVIYTGEVDTEAGASDSSYGDVNTQEDSIDSDSDSEAGATDGNWTFFRKEDKSWV